MTARIRTLVATGASSGLGFETLKQLLASTPKETSYRVILGARDPIKASQAYSNLNDSSNTNSVTCHALDLANLKSVQAFGEKVRQDLGDQSIDTLFIAGGIVKPAAKEPQYAGYSEAYMVNHLSQHYLLHLLQDKLSPGSSRIVFVSSMKLKEVKDPESLQDMLSSDSQLPAIQIYQATKFVQLLSALHWRRKLEGKAEVIAVSPGFVPSSGLSRNTEYGYLGRLAMYYLVSLLPFATSLKDGGTAILRAITGEYELQDEDHMLLNNKGEFEKLDIKLLDYDLQEKWCPSQAEIEERFGA